MALFFVRPAAAQSRACPVPLDDVALTQTKWAPPLDRPIVMSGGAVSLREALLRVASIAKVRLSYSAELLPLDEMVCLPAAVRPIGRVLGDLLSSTNVTAVGLGGDQVVLAPRSPAAERAEPAPPQMAQTTSVLDRVVITGSAVRAPDREATFGTDVLSGQQLVRDHVSTLSAALDGYVPGIWSWPQSPSSVLTSYGSIRGASSFGLSYPKVYIDGIEVANPLLVTRFATDAIDRIEVIRGPQGSALYGTDAISGVINIVTRHEGTGVEGDHASIRTTGGLVQSDYARHGTLTQSHSLNFGTGSTTRSADLHISASSVGDFIPDGYSRDLMATGSTRVVGDRYTLSGTARYFTQEAGSATSPLVPRPTPAPSSGITQLMRDSLPQSVHQYTIGANGTFVGNDRWTHSATVGVDGYDLANVKSNSPIPSVALQDSALRAAEGSAIRGTARVSSALRLSDTDALRATLTFSAEHGVFRSVSPAEMPAEQTTLPTTGTVTGGPVIGSTVSRAEPRSMVMWQHNTGITTQANASFNDMLFVTGGIRLERDSRLPGTQIAALPMIGVASVRDYGPVSVKLRGAYGEGIRPPATFGHLEPWQGACGGWNSQQNVGAEKQAGTEAGFDLTLQRKWSVRVTRFDQRASGLIQCVRILDPVSRRFRYDLENIGQISNNGWEFETSANVSRLSASATLSLVRSRVDQVATGYRGDLLAGDRMLQVPAGTGSVALSWLGSGWTASLGASRALDWINYDELSLANAYLGGTTTHDLEGQQLRQYWRRYNGGLRVRASATRDFRNLFTFEVSGDNLLGYQLNEPDNLTVLPGRTLMTGVKIKF
jgi:outer membrane cobalamin receptor